MANKPISDRWIPSIGGFTLLFLAAAGGVAVLLGTGLSAFLTGAGIGEGVVIMAAFGVFALLILPGLSVLEPNQAAVVLFVGSYVGTLRRSGFVWTLPYTDRRLVSLRVETLTTKTLKVNDIDGNPIEIGAVVVWRVKDAARATLNVENYDQYVIEQSETALRAFATRYAYDAPDGEVSLRASQDELSDALSREIAERVAVAGAEVIEARISHLAYASEIAASLLKRQQARATVAARRLISENAVEMAQDAIRALEQDPSFQFSADRKAALVSNLIVALVADDGAQPVIDLKS